MGERGLTASGHKGTPWSEGRVLNLDCVAVAQLYKFYNCSCNCTLKMSKFYNM